MNTKKAIILGTLSAILVGLCSFAIAKNKSNNAKPKIQTAYADDTRATTLYNTNWKFSRTVSPLSPTNDPMFLGNGINVNETYYLNFTSNNENFTKIEFKKDERQRTSTLKFIKSNNAEVTIVNYTQRPNYNQTYKYIHITDGTSQNNVAIYTWFTLNAEKVITNIENTSWKLNHTLSITAAYGQFTANIYSNGYKYTQINIGYESLDGTTLTPAANSFTYSTSYTFYRNNVWEHERQYSRILITTGTDTENPYLIFWLNDNATQMEHRTSVLNTKWTFESQIYVPAYNTELQNYNIQFTTNRKQSFFMRVGRQQNTIDYAIKVNEQTPYNLMNVCDTYWTASGWQTIIITSNETIINDAVNDVNYITSFLQSNATGITYTPIPTDGNDYDIEDGNFTSLQAMILRILTLPFTFLSQAFNVTLWEGTAWEFNISNFIMAIIAIAAILFIIKLFTSGFSVIGNYTSNRAETKLTKSKTKLNKQQIKQNKEKAKKDK